MHALNAVVNEPQVIVNKQHGETSHGWSNRQQHGETRGVNWGTLTELDRGGELRDDQLQYPALTRRIKNIFPDLHNKKLVTLYLTRSL